jgi:urea transport system permease protein
MSAPTVRRLEFIAVAVIAVLLIVVFPLLNSAGVISNFTLNLWGKYLCYALLAISVDLLWGYTGLLSLGQALFFSLGGYMLGMHLMRMIGELGQYKKPIPDFLVFLGWTELPSFWIPFSSFTFAAAMVFSSPASSRSSSASSPSAPASRASISPSSRRRSPTAPRSCFSATTC